MTTATVADVLSRIVLGIITFIIAYAISVVIVGLYGAYQESDQTLLDVLQDGVATLATGVFFYFLGDLVLLLNRLFL